MITSRYYCLSQPDGKRLQNHYLIQCLDVGRTKDPQASHGPGFMMYHLEILPWLFIPV